MSSIVLMLLFWPQILYCAGAPPPIAAAEYDPATGTYIGPDGHAYVQSDLARNGAQAPSWQQMLIPPTGN